MLDIKGAIVSIDAMGCQKAIARQIVSQDTHYILALKENQPELHTSVKDYFETAKTANFRSVPATYHEQTDVGHGRVEVRRCCLVNDTSTLPKTQNWSGLQSVAMIESERHRGSHTTHESRYYITTLMGEAKIVAEAVRAHWGIKNKLHWVLDVTFRKDDSRIRRGNAPTNFNTLRQFSLNLINVHFPLGFTNESSFHGTLLMKNYISFGLRRSLTRHARSNTSVKQSRLKAAWNDSFRFKVLSQQ